MDVFEHWETTSATAPTSGGIYQQGSLLTSGGDGDALHQNSPSRRNVAVRRRERGSENDDDAGSSIVHLNDIFSLRRIDMSAVLAAAGASTNTLIKPSTAANAPASTSSFHSSLTSTTAIGVASRTQQDQVTIEHVAVQNGVVVLCLSNAKFIRWGLTGTFEPQVIPLPSATSTPLHALGNHKRRGGSTSTPSTSGVYKVFLDPTGSHLLVSTRAAEHFYLHARAHSFSRLHKWHGVVVEAVAFDAVYGSESSTRSILLGSNRGEFFEAVLERGLGADKWLGGSSSSASNSGGAGGSGSDPQGPNLKKVHALEDPLPIRSLVVETVEGGGGREGGLAESGVGGGGSTPPEDRQRLVLAATSGPVQHLPIEEASPLPLLHDPVHESFWLPTPHSLFQIVFLPDQEDRDVWRLYLERALLPSPSPASLDPARRFDMAYRYCKDTASRAVVDAAQAAYFFRSKEYELAARCYAKLPPGRGGGKEGGPVGKSFEEIALKFVDVGEEEALKVYLLERLARFQAGEGGGEDGREGGEYKTQRVMLCTWLMEMYLKRLAVLEGTGRGRQGPAEEEEVGRTVEEFQAFLRAHVEDLRIHPAATYQALGSHGRKREMLLFATLIDDVDRVVAFHVGEGEYGPALQLLEEAASERVEGLFHKYAHTLMDAAPLRTLRAWMKTPGLDPVRLLPALAKHIALSSPTTSVPPSPRKQGRGPGEPRTESEAAEVRELGTQFLEHCVASSSQPASSHRQHSSLLPSSSVSAILPNYLLQLYATTDEKEEKLLDFLQTHAPVWTSGMEEDGRGRGGGRGGGRAATPAHSLVTPTLDLQYALLVCSMHRRTRSTHAHGTGVEEGGEALRKRLWQMIARHVIEVGKASPAEAMRLLDESAVLTVEDLIPFFPDFTTIDAFKEKICDSLSQYSSTIQGLKQEMEELAQSTVEMESAVAALRGRHLSIANSQRCGLCRTSAFAHQFYVFPCQHAFHATCLAHHILPYLNTSQRRAVQALQEQLAAEYFGFNEGMGGGVRGSGRKMSQRKAAQVEALQGEIDGYLAAECPFCGDVMIRSIDEPLVGEGEEAKAEAEEWEIM
ncbi:vacuolar protein sorting protein [Nannochloropsis gaditana]|uniref:Vacuolar protein sorting protein n=1 Tax=Nannochloropsis gaditana TaxID=72520 RepID=W7TUA0_9STRA|nr:vacuolar protein sorting protein [Nannochloropsis gaditana]